MPQPLTILLVEKTGELKTLSVKDFKEDELFKKCGFKKSDDFTKQVEWPIKFDGQKYTITMHGKTDGKANMENKYDFPPPVDNKLFFGCCVLVGNIRDDNNNKSLINMSLELWTKLYEKLFGGFEDLNALKNDDNDNDDDEEDELDIIPKSKKTKGSSYLKDGFVVDDDEENEDNMSGSSDESDDSDEEDININDANDENVLLLEDIGSELSEEEYDYN